MTTAKGSDMPLTIMHTGQTGVERGADRAARTIDLPISGCSAFEQRDELGRLPDDIRVALAPCQKKGARSAHQATLAQSDVLIIAVPDATSANTVAGIEALRREARAAKVPQWIVDPISDLDEMAIDICRMERSTGSLRVMVTGPRLTRWPAGERLGFRVVAALSIVPTRIVADHSDAQLTRDVEPHRTP